MKKFILAVFIGMVLAINLYGVVNNIMTYYESKDVAEINKGYTFVYME